MFACAVFIVDCLLWTPAQRKRASMLYFANVFIYLFFFMAALFSGPGERRFTKVLHVVDLECHWRSYYLDFFLVIHKLQGGPKSDEISHIFRPRPQTFYSHARTRQNIVILKNSLSTDGFSTTYATFGELWPTNPWDPRAPKFFKNDTREYPATCLISVC